jgi:hypothetical protein
VSSSRASSIRAGSGRRPGPLLALLGAVALALCGCRKQPRAAGPQVPERTPLGGYGVGAFSEYAITSPEQQLGMTISVVDRRLGLTSVEVRMIARTGAALPSMTMRHTLRDGQSFGDRPTAIAIQVDGHAPMDQPDDGGDAFKDMLPARVDKGTWVADQPITTPAGTFATSLYHLTDPDGSVSDLWLAKEIAPTGMVKLRVVAPDGTESTTELRRIGTGAAPRITANPAPFDQAKLARQMIASLGAGLPGSPAASAPGD